ncbi:FAD-dependent oxidoreductase [Streptomyces sp. NPDC001985]|uniref:FAD-dependent oxidoreductase n=1 Tax=Streptomyces sp. NPDC001985 TaxID=3154406 RepID=UPI00331B0215
MSGQTRTAVIGGGMAGSAAAKTLLKAGREVVVFEAADGLGGRARSWHRPEIEPDVGINLMYVSFYGLMTQLIEEYGLKDDLLQISSNVYISDHGKALPLSSDSPLSLLKYGHVSVRDRLAFLVTSLAQVAQKKKLSLFDPIMSAPHDNQSATEWGYGKVSRRGFDFLLRPQIEGFWNFACEEISAIHARALLAWMGGSGFYVLKDGMEVIAERNAEGAELRLGHEVTSVQSDGGSISVTATGPGGGEPVTETFDDVVIATPATIAAKLVSALPAEIVSGITRGFLETQRYEPAISVSYLVDADALPAEAHIVAGGPEDPPIRNMITYPRTTRDERGRPVEKLLVLTYPGRANTRRLLGLTPEEQFAAVTPLLPSLWADFPVDTAVPFQIAERPYGFPIPAPGRYRRSAEVIRQQRAPVVFAGDYFNSPTTEAAMLSGIRAAAALTKAG